MTSPSKKTESEVTEAMKRGCLEDSRSKDKALAGNLAGMWRYRVGGYRIPCDVNDGGLVVLVIDVAHAREVYRRR